MARSNQTRTALIDQRHGDLSPGAPPGARAPFQIDELPEDGYVRLKLTGELDLSTSQLLSDWLDLLASDGAQVRLDLSELEFMDSSGLQVLICAHDSADGGAWRLEVEPDLSPQVRRLFQITGAMKLVGAAGRAGS